MNLIIFGNTDRWSDAVHLIVTYRPDVCITGLCSPDLGDYRDSDATVTINEALELFLHGQIDGIVNINGENPYYFELLEAFGFSPIYVLPSYLSLQEKRREISPNEALLYPYKKFQPNLCSWNFIWRIIAI